MYIHFSFNPSFSALLLNIPHILFLIMIANLHGGVTVSFLIQDHLHEIVNSVQVQFTTMQESDSFIYQIIFMTPEEGKQSRLLSLSKDKPAN